MNKKIKISIIIIASIALLFFITFANQKTLNVKVNSIDKIEKTSGDKDGFNTEIYYLLYTDKGTFRISISGLVAHPEFAGMLKKDSVYDITICGVEAPLIGMYKNVIDVK